MYDSMFIIEDGVGAVEKYCSTIISYRKMNKYTMRKEKCITCVNGVYKSQDFEHRKTVCVIRLR